MIFGLLKLSKTQSSVYLPGHYKEKVLHLLYCNRIKTTADDLLFYNSLSFFCTFF